jgi:capsular polysaccharide biosynthesis protein
MKEMEKEISITEMIMKIWAGRRIVVVVTVVAILFGYAYGNFYLKPIYEVTNTVVVNTQEVPNLQQVTEQIKNSFILDRIIKKAGLESKGFNRPTLRKIITLEPNEKAKLIRIRVEGDSPKTITSIANVVALELGGYLELSSRTTSISEMSNRMTEIENELDASKGELELSKNELNSTEEKLQLKKTVLNEDGLHTADPGVQLIDEEINPVYIELKSKVSELTLNIVRLESEYKSLEKKIKDYREKINEINQMTTDNSNLQLDDYLKSVDPSSVVLIAPAIEPLFPIGPNKMLIMVASAIFGLFVGSAIALIRALTYTEKKKSD